MKINGIEYWLIPCPHCWKEIYAREDRMGKVIICIHCKEKFKWVSETEIDPMVENWKG